MIKCAVLHRESESLYSPHSYLRFPKLVSFLTPTHITSMERMHRFSRRIITGCLSSTLIPLLHLEALLPHCVSPPLSILFSYFKSALRLPSSFSFAFLAHHNPRTHLKKGLWRSFSISHNLTSNLQVPCEPLILCPPKSP